MSALSRNTTFAVWLIWGILFWGCEDKQALLIEEDKLVKILVDAHLAESSVQSKTRNQKMELLAIHYNRIFEIHQVDSIAYDSSMAVLKNDPEHLMIVYEKVMEEIDRQKTD